MKNSRNNGPAFQSGLKALHDIPFSSDARAPQADITNQRHLFGDPFDYGDTDEDGDPDDDDEMGDVDLYGDPDPLAMFTTISGDPDDSEMGGPSFIRKGFSRIGSGLKGAGKWASKHKKGIALTAGAIGGGLLARKAYKAWKRRQADKLAARTMLRKARASQTLRAQRSLEVNSGSINKKSKMHFFSLKGAKMNSSPIDPNSYFVMDTLKVMLDRQQTDSPFFQETAIGTFAAGTWTAQAVGGVDFRLFTAMFLQIGTNILNAAPGTVMNITATIPLFDGTVLTINPVPFLFTYEAAYDVRFLMFPWKLVSNKPEAMLGRYNNANPITVQVTGLPSASAVNLVIPGTIHPWTIAMRNSLI